MTQWIPLGDIDWGHERAFWGPGNVLYLDLDSGYVGVHTQTHTIMKLTLKVSGIYVLNYVCYASVLNFI